MSITVQRTLEMAAVFMIGDGLLGVLQPKRHVELWQSEISAVDMLIRPFKGRPGRRRAYGMLQLGGGLILASALTRRSDENG